VKTLIVSTVSAALSMLMTFTLANALNGQPRHIVLTYGEVMHVDCPNIMETYLISNSSITLTCESIPGRDLEGETFNPPSIPKTEPGKPNPKPTNRATDCAGRRHPERCD
jgi:hypothetical protein